MVGKKEFKEIQCLHAVEWILNTQVDCGSSNSANGNNVS